LLISCGDDDDNATPAVPIETGFVGTGTGSMNSGNLSYTLDKGITIDFGTTQTGLFNYEIELYSGSFALANNEPTGMGNYLYLDLFSASAGRLQNGTYTLGSGGSADRVLDYAEFAAEVDYDTFNSAVGYINFESGTVTVDGSGDFYILNFDLIALNGANYTGSYSGTLRKYIAE
jgi:hypothetical protein